MKRKNPLPFVSLLIANYNGRDILKACLPALYKLEYPKDRYEIIVVDNASTDGSIEFLKKHYKKIKIIKNEENLGYVGLNSGIGYCKGMYIYFLNNDLILEKNCLLNLVGEIEKNEDIGMAVHTGINYYSKLVSGGTWASRAMYCGHYLKRDSQNTKEIPYMGAGLIRKSVVEKFGYLFDPDYFIYAEDFDLGLRIRLIGMNTIIVRKAECYHMHSLTMKRYSTPARNTYLLERNLLTTFFKIFSAKTVTVYMPYVLGFRILSIAKDLLQLKIKNAWSRVMALLWVIVNFRFIMEKRNQVQKFREVNDDFILKVFRERYILRKPVLI